MADGLMRILAKPGFDPQNFVNKQSNEGEENLQRVKESIDELYADTADALKKNVYKNYTQFIETSKEVSILEGEMYQLSHMLSDQKSVIANMLELSVTGDPGVDAPVEHEKNESDDGPEDKTKNLVFLLEKSVTEVPDRYLVHDGDLVEVDSETHRVVAKVHLFLLNDSIMITNWLSHRRGPVRYELKALYELRSLAVVNIRDVGQCKNAFNFLIFPVTRTFQAESPKAKRQWLDIIEETKKKKTALDNQRKEAAQKAALAELERKTIAQDPNNPFADEAVVPPAPADIDLLHEDWLQELPEELDVFIAQREFEQAVDLVERVTEYLDKCPKSATVREYRARVDQRVKQLTQVLMRELRISPERSIRGGPRAARRAITQLIRLGKSAEACRLFLGTRSAIATYNVRQLKIEGATSLYIKRLCDVFFSNLLETGREFAKAFPQLYGCFSAFVVWAESEIDIFVSLFKQQVFVSKADSNTLAECISLARVACDQLSQIGLEMTFVLEGRLMPEMEKSVRDGIAIQIAAIKSRAEEDKWRPENYQKIEALEQFEEEMMKLGFLNIHQFSFDGCFTRLTSNCIHFSKNFLSFVDDLLKMHCEDLHHDITAGIQDIMAEMVSQAEKAMANPKLKEEHKCIVENVAFLVDSLFPLIETRYAERTNGQRLNTEALKSALDRIQKLGASTVGEFV